MRSLTVVLSLILALLLAFCGFFYAGGTLRAEVSRISAPASEHAESFSQVRDVLESGGAPVLFDYSGLGDISAYTLMDVDVILTNRGIFDAEWLNVEAEGIDGDVAVYSLTGDGTDVPARGTGHINLKYITRAPADAPRRLKLQYYVYGISRTIEIDY